LFTIKEKPKPDPNDPWIKKMTAIHPDNIIPRRPDSCKPIQPHERVVAFWQTEVNGCEDVWSSIVLIIIGC
jgi:hypothetical protein